MSLGSTQPGSDTYYVSAEFSGGLLVNIDPDAFSGTSNLTDVQTLVDALRGAGATVAARQYSGDYKDILTP
jgi:hypothetical protein